MRTLIVVVLLLLLPVWAQAVPPIDSDTEVVMEGSHVALVRQGPFAFDAVEEAPPLATGENTYRDRTLAPASVHITATVSVTAGTMSGTLRGVLRAKDGTTLQEKIVYTFADFGPDGTTHGADGGDEEMIAITGPLDEVFLDVTTCTACAGTLFTVGAP